MRRPSLRGRGGDVMTWSRLVLASARTTRGLTLLTALVVAVTTALVTMLPALTDRASRDWLGESLRRAPVMGRSVLVTLPTGIGAGFPGGDPAAPFARVATSVQRLWGPETSQLYGPVRPMAATNDAQPLAPTPQGVVRSGQLVLTPAFESRVRWTAGRAPRPSAERHVLPPAPATEDLSVQTAGPGLPDPATLPPETIPTLEVGLSTVAADSWGTKVGERWTMPAASGTATRLHLLVSGIYEPTDPRDDLWQWMPQLAGISLIEEGGANGGVQPAVGLVLSPDVHQQVVAISALSNTVNYSWTWRVDDRRVRPADLPALTSGLARVASAPSEVTDGAVSVRSTLSGTLSSWRDGVRATRLVDGTVTTGLLVLAAALAVLLARLRTERRRRDDDLLRSRGASMSRLGLLAALDVSMPVVLGAALGWGVAALTTQSVLPPWWALGLAAAAVLAHVGATVLGARDRGRGQRGGRLARVGAASRLAPVLALVALAVLAVITVRQRPAEPTTPRDDLITAGRAAQLSTGDITPDPLVQAVPALVAVVVGLLLLALVRAASSVAARIVDRRPGGRSWLGLTQAARAGGASRLPLVALTVAAALAVLTSTLGHTLVQARELQTWREVGADAQVTGSRLDASVVETVRRRPGVQSVAALGETSGQLLSDSTGADARAQVAVRVGSVQEVASVRAGTPIAVHEASTSTATPTSTFTATSTATSTSTSPQGDGVTLVVGRDRPVLHQPGLRIEINRRSAPVRTVVVDESLQDTTTQLIALAPRDQVERLTGSPVPTTTLLVRATPVASASLVAEARTLSPLVEQAVDRTTVAARAADQPLSRHVLLVVLLTSLAAALLAALAAYALTAATAAARRQLLARARVLGMPARDRHTVVLVQVLPPALAAVVTGLATGLGLPWLLPRLVDLAPFAGGEAYPRLVPSWPTVAAIAIGLSVLVSAVVALDLRSATRLSLTRHLRAGDQ